MNTKFYFLPTLLLGSLSLFSACSDDDENGSGQPSTPVIGPDGTNSGARLTNISNGYGGLVYSYNEDGTLNKAEWRAEEEWISMTYNPLRISVDNYGELKKVSFNKSGFLTHYMVEWNDIEEDDYSSTGKGVYKYSYNGDGTLSKVVVTYSGKDVEDGESFPYYGSWTATFSWTKGNVTQIKIAWNEVEDGSSWKGTDTYKLEYTDEINKYQQYVFGMPIADNDYEDLIAPIGWLGKWSKNYPASCEMEWVEEDSDGEKQEGSDTNTWSNFSTTSDGLLSGFYYNRSRYTYTYESTAFTAKKASTKQTLDNYDPSPRAKKMSRRHLRHAKMLIKK